MGKDVKKQILEKWAKFGLTPKKVAYATFEQPNLALTRPRRARFEHLLPLGALYIAAREGTHTLIHG